MLGSTRLPPVESHVDTCFHSRTEVSCAPVSPPRRAGLGLFDSQRGGVCVDDARAVGGTTVGPVYPTLRFHVGDEEGDRIEVRGEVGSQPTFLRISQRRNLRVLILP